MAIPMSTLSMQRYECPRCHAKPGTWCVEPSGRPKSSGLGAHGERMDLLKPAEKDLSLIGKGWTFQPDGKVKPIGSPQ